MRAFKNVSEIDINKITPDTEQYFVHRVELNEALVTAIASSLEKGPLLQPIVVTSDKEMNYYLILDGHHRYTAAKRLGWKTVPCKFIDFEQAPLIAIQANLVRADLNALERAISYNAWLSLRQQSNPDYKKKDLANEVGLSEATISQYTALRKLPKNILDQAKDNVLPITLLYQLAISQEKDKWKEKKYTTLNKNYAQWTARKEASVSAGKRKREPSKPETRHQKVCNKVMNSIRSSIKNIQHIDVKYSSEDSQEKKALIDLMIDTVTAISSFKNDVLGKDEYR